MNPLVLAVAIGLLGTLAAALWTFAIGVAGSPGALYTASLMSRRGLTAIPTSGLLLTILGQAYISLVWVTFVVESTRSLLGEAGGFGKLLVWAMAWWVAGAPAWMALKDSARAEVKNVQHGATTFTAPLTFVAFFVFTFFPKAITLGWAWVPHI